jgi:hypothetical protein
MLFLEYFLLRFSNSSANTLYDEIFIWLVSLMLIAYPVWDSIKSGLLDVSHVKGIRGDRVLNGRLIYNIL